jgi:elongator complex protein 1
MRTNRIDMNLLYDHNPNEFIDNVELFIKQINNVEYINLFLSNLTNENSIETQFPKYIPLPSTKKTSKKETTTSNELQAMLLNNTETKRGKRDHLDRKLKELKAAELEKKPINIHEGKTKVNLICDVMKEMLISIDSKKFVLCTLTTLVKKKPQELEAALLMIKTIRENERGGMTGNAVISTMNTVNIEPTIPQMKKLPELGKIENKSTGMYSGSVGALKYVIFLCDVNELYNVALGLYDFDLVMLCAQYSQKDPKEYLPFLTGLQQLVK